MVTAYKPWRCPRCGTVLGVVERNASRKPILYVLRLNLIPHWWTMRPPEELVSCALEGDGKVYCPVCGQARRWVAKEEKDGENND